MGAIVEDVRTAAEWVAQALRASGYAADFGAASLWEIDRFFDENSRNGRGRGLLADQLGQRLFAIGAYAGEVVRRAKGGEWVGDDASPQAEIDVELRLPDGTRLWPVQRAMKRFRNGEEDAIAAWGRGAGLDVGAAPARPAPGRPWWKPW
jgi:hypothetical protein